MSYQICLDPGHNSSGADTGAEGYGLREQDLTLDIVQRIKPLLEYNGFSVVTTRDGDFVKGGHSSVNASLQTRCDIANNAKADLFCSIHINAGGGTGTEIYCYKFGGQAEIFANKMIYYLLQSCQWTNRGVKEEHLYVLANTNMPAILTENGFIDTEFDSSKLKDSNFLQKIAIAHAKGICDYFGVVYKEQGGQKKMDNLVVYYGDGDKDAASLLSYRLQCPMILKAFATPYLTVAKNIFLVGGPNDIPGAKYYSGSDRIQTAILALTK